MILALLLAVAGCTATTDVPEFKDQIERACGERIQAVSFMGNHEAANFTITFTFTLTGRQIAETITAVQAWQAAKVSHEILNAAYPMKRFEYLMRDANSSEICRFVFEGDEEKPVTGTCMSEVE